MLGVSNINKKKLSNVFIQQGLIKWIKSDSKDIYNVKNDFYFQ